MQNTNMHMTYILLVLLVCIRGHYFLKLGHRQGKLARHVLQHCTLYTIDIYECRILLYIDFKRQEMIKKSAHA